MSAYEDKVISNAFNSFKKLEEYELQISKLSQELEDCGWLIQAVSYQVFKECGVFELYTSQDKLNGSFISDRISDAFYDADSIQEFYDSINYILLEKESGLAKYTVGGVTNHFV